MPFVLPKNPAEGAHCLRTQLVFTTNEHIAAHLALRKPLSTSPYIFVVAGSDFAVPVPSTYFSPPSFLVFINIPSLDVTHAMDAWNDEMYPETGFVAAMGTFDEFANLVQSFHANGTSANALKKRSWSGKTEDVGLCEFRNGISSQGDLDSFSPLAVLDRLLLVSPSAQAVPLSRMLVVPLRPHVVIVTIDVEDPRAMRGFVGHSSRVEPQRGGLFAAVH